MHRDLTEISAMRLMLILAYVLYLPSPTQQPSQWAMKPHNMKNDLLGSRTITNPFSNAESEEKSSLEKPSLRLEISNRHAIVEQAVLRLNSPSNCIKRHSVEGRELLGVVERW